MAKPSPLSTELAFIVYRRASDFERYNRKRLLYTDTEILVRIVRSRGLFHVEYQDCPVGLGPTRDAAISHAERFLESQSERELRDAWAPDGRPRVPNDDW